MGKETRGRIPCPTLRCNTTQGTNKKNTVGVSAYPPKRCSTIILAIGAADTRVLAGSSHRTGCSSSQQHPQPLASESHRMPARSRRTPARGYALIPRHPRHPAVAQWRSQKNTRSPGYSAPHRPAPPGPMRCTPRTATHPGDTRISARPTSATDLHRHTLPASRAPRRAADRSHTSRRPPVPPQRRPATRGARQSDTPRSRPDAAGIGRPAYERIGDGEWDRPPRRPTLALCQ